MVGMMPATWREKIAGRINSVNYAADVPSKLDHLRRLKDEISDADSRFLVGFLSPLLDLISDRSSPVRKFITQMIGKIGLKHLEFLPEIVPVLVTVLKDEAPAVARQAIACGIDIFRCTLVKVAVQGLYSSELNESLKSSWASVLKFRDEIYSMAFQVGTDGRRLAALKFVESVIVLYTPDPNGSLELPPDQFSEGKFEEFNISWLRGGHPILNVGDLSVEASQKLGLLLDQLRFPTVKSLSSLTIIVLIKSLSAVARKRPAFYGRILPVLLGLDPSSSASKGMHLSGVHHALKNAFESCLNCTHPGAAPWRDRLVSALKEMKAGSSAAQALNQICEDNGRADWKADSRTAQGEKPSIEALAAEHADAGRKRSGVHDISDVPVDELSGKRARTGLGVSEESVHETSGIQEGVPSSGPVTSTSDADNGPVQQLVAMFGALVAQGEKAVASLEILISSISADLLAEVVMANMRNLSPNRPNSDGDEEPVPMMGSHSGMIGSDMQLKNLSSLLTDILSRSGSFPHKHIQVEAHHSLSSGFELDQGEEDLKSKSEPLVTLDDSNVAYDSLDSASQQATEPIIGSVSAEHIPSGTETGYPAMTSDTIDVETVVNEIPGLASSTQDYGLPGTVAVFSLDSTDLEDTSPEQVTGLGRSPLELAPSMSTDRSEELSPKAAVMDVASFNSLTATSVGLPTPLILPKMSAPVIYLADEQKDKLQESAFLRIIDAYKQIAVASDSQLRFSILAHSGIKFPSELDLWKPLQAHILSDYVNHEGHELTLRVLYRLHGEAEEDRDFVSSTTAKSVYEMFLLKVAETLRDSFPASEKFLSRLLVEVPYLPKSIFEMLECLCSPGSSDHDDKELHSGDRVTQGLSAIWSLVLLRPPIRDSCLKIALKSATHHLEEVRMKAIRLVANKLYPLSSISEKIEDFAKEMLLLVANVDLTTERSDTDGLNAGSQKDEQPSSDNQSVSDVVKDISADTHQLTSSESISSSSIAEVQRFTSLYFALCTKKHSLFRQILDVYKNMSKVAKQAVHRQIPLLVRTIGSSPNLLDIISDPPTGSEGLLMQVVHTLTDGTVPSPELISTIRKLYDTKVKEIDILIPVLSFLPKHEVLLIFSHLVNAPLDKFQAALSRVLQGSTHSGPVLTPEEALIAIHGIDPDRDGIPLKKVTDACNACFEQRQIFSQQVLAKVLNQLVEQIPLPLLFMRTVLQAIGAFPSLVDFIMEILSRLVSKQIWKYPKLWVGFVKCAQLTKPQSFSVLLQLPPAQLENAVNRTPAIKAPLVAHARQPHIKSSLPRSTLVVLGIASDSQTSSQIQPNQTEAGDTGNSDKETVMEKSKESSTISLEKTDVLSDQQKRAIYDQYGEEGLKGQVPPPGAGGFSGMSDGGGPNMFRFNPRSADDIFSEFFGFNSPFGGMGDMGGGSRTGGPGFPRGMFGDDIFTSFRSAAGGDGVSGGMPRKGAPIERMLPCSLEDLYKGTTKKMKISRDVMDPSGRPSTVEEILTIEIKPGWKKGTKITFPEKGNEQRGVIPSDLVFIIDEKPHSVFKRDGNDIIVSQKISLVEALTGYTAEVTTLDGRNLTIPINSMINPTYEEVVKGEGMPVPKEPSKRGNLRIKFNIKFPSRLTSEQKAGVKRLLTSS
ncbi:HEAT repeat-containing protein [Abeliophyllum distichum]|uniref:HEAT repeat-containing protein n=1 Tax=Abeliophyllum distichum TaxID=126358 RepID=A0ABD1VY53_9LAMI